MRSNLFLVVPRILIVAAVGTAAAASGCAVEVDAAVERSAETESGASADSAGGSGGDALRGINESSAEISNAAHRPRVHVLVVNSRGDNIVGYDEHGALLGELIPAGRGGISHPDTAILGPDRRLYVSSGDEPATSAVLRFDARTGAFLGVFASGHGLHRPYGMAFGDDGLFYVASFMSDEIFRFDARTGAFVDVFARGDGQPGGLNGPNSLAFGPDGALYVTTEGSVAGQFPGLPSQVLRYSPRTGAHRVFIEQPAPSPSSLGFVSLLGIVFGPDCDRPGRGHDRDRCDVFVSDFANDVRRYDFATGALEHQFDTNYTGTLPSNNFTGGLAFDRRGRMFVVGFDRVAEGNPGAVLRFDGVRNRPLPANHQPGAVFVAPSPVLARPIGVLALD